MSQKNKKNSHHIILKSMSGLMAWTAWLLIFFVGTIKGNIPNAKLMKATNSVVASSNNKVNLPSNNPDPLQLPEDSEGFISEFDDESDDHKKSILAISFIQLFTVLQINEIQSVQSFQYNQSRQQIIAIPLFVLHHSWKSYLV
ncbi:MAG TPA: hypothetical protein PL108_03695 [Sediminibacterium sp.]|nr:hypothetical protein [Sediminibacterium sp.]